MHDHVVVYDCKRPYHYDHNTDLAVHVHVYSLLTQVIMTLITNYTEAN